MLTTHHGVPHKDVPRGKPIRLVTSGLHSQYTHADGRQGGFAILNLLLATSAVFRELV